MPTPTRWRRIADSEWTPFLVSLAVGVWAIFASIFPDGMEAQAGIMADQVSLTETQFAAQFRPKLAVRKIYVGKPNDDGKQTYFCVELAAVGFVGVRIQEYRAILIPFGVDDLPEPWRVKEGLDRSGAQGFDMRAGDSHVFETHVHPDNDVGEIFNVPDAGCVYCIGYVAYTNPGNKGTYRLGFVRRAYGPNEPFWKVDYPDFDYED